MKTKPTRSEVLRALADGMTVEFEFDAGYWTPANDANEYYELAPTKFHSPRWRILDPPAPKRMVPLGPEDVPPGSVIYVNGSRHTWSIVTSVTNDGVCCAGYAGAFLVKWSELTAKNYEISRDGGKTWQRCEKEEA